MTQEWEEMNVSLTKYVREMIHTDKLHELILDAAPSWEFENGAGERIVEAGNKSIIQSTNQSVETITADEEFLTDEELTDLIRDPEKLEAYLKDFINSALVSWYRCILSAFRQEFEAAYYVTDGHKKEEAIEEIMNAFNGEMYDMIHKAANEKIM